MFDRLGPFLLFALKHSGLDVYAFARSISDEKLLSINILLGVRDGIQKRPPLLDVFSLCFLFDLVLDNIRLDC